jgi:DNA polymerase elongation subunit (family B)
MKQYLNVSLIKFDQMYVRGYDTDTGEYYSEEIKYKPTSYKLITDPNAPPSPFKTIHGEPLKEFKHESIAAYREKRMDNTYGMENHLCAFMTENFTTDFDPTKTRIFWLDIENEMTSDDGVRGGFPDPNDAACPITAITIYDTITSKYHLFACRDWNNKEYEHLDIEFNWCEDEKTLLKTFWEFWTKNYPHIVTGWNISGYDIPFLYNRMKKVFNEKVAKKLAPRGLVHTRTYINGYQEEQTEYYLRGLSIVDYLQTYKKFTFGKLPNYKLDTVAEFELGKGKVDFREFGYSDLDDLYERNPQMYLDYNIRDVEALIEIEAKNHFMDIVMATAHYSLVNYDEVSSVIKCWDSLIHRYLKEQNIITSPKERNTKKESFKGAHVKEPRPGSYKWVSTFDLKALYPNIMRTGNIGIETIIEKEDLPDELKMCYGKDFRNAIVNGEVDFLIPLLKKYDLSMMPNGMFYHNKSVSIYSDLAENILAERDIDKKKMIEAQKEFELTGSDEAKDKIARYKNSQLVKKVLANSLYGVAGNAYNRYYDIRIAQSITYMGQVIIRWVEKNTNELLNKLMKTEDFPYCIYMDTDSIFVNFEPVVKNTFKDVEADGVIDFLDRTGELMNDHISKFLNELGDIVNTHNNQLSMKREVISSTTIITSKKKYAMAVLDNEGVRYSKPKFKIMGMEIIKSTSSKYIREKLKTALIMLLEGTTKKDILNFIEETKSDFMEHDFVDDISLNSSLKSLATYEVEITNLFESLFDNDKPKITYKKSTPIYYRAAILYNVYFGTHDSKIQTGDSVKYIHLTLPNFMSEDVIGWNDKFPEALRSYIDKELMFDKLFISPLEKLTLLFKWDIRTAYESLV